MRYGQTSCHSTVRAMQMRRAVKKSDITRSAGEGGLSIDCQITIKAVSKQYIMIDGISNAVPWTEQRHDSFRTPISLMIVNVKQSDLSAVCLQ